MTRVLGIIPARFASTRFPGKPLADISGKPMIQHVYEQCLKAEKLDKVLVATDDERIMNTVKNFGGLALMTDADHQSGTDRCYEAFIKSEMSFDFVINIQGDEPLIAPGQIDQLAGLLDEQIEIATLVKQLIKPRELFDPNVVKVVFDKKQYALFFSRSTIPYLRNVSQEKWLSEGQFFKHIGIYAYRTDVLANFSKLEPSVLEKAESLEQLRWLDNGYTIKVKETEYESIGIDTPEDLTKLEGLI